MVFYFDFHIYKNLIKTADANQDGIVTKEEFIAAIDKIKAGGRDSVPGN